MHSSESGLSGRTVAQCLWVNACRRWYTALSVGGSVCARFVHVYVCKVTYCSNTVGVMFFMWGLFLGCTRMRQAFSKTVRKQFFTLTSVFFTFRFRNWFKWAMARVNLCSFLAFYLHVITVTWRSIETKRNMKLTTRQSRVVKTHLNQFQSRRNVKYIQKQRTFKSTFCPKVSSLLYKT